MLTHDVVRDVEHGLQRIVSWSAMHVQSALLLARISTNEVFFFVALRQNLMCLQAGGGPTLGHGRGARHGLQ